MMDIEYLSSLFSSKGKVCVYKCVKCKYFCTKRKKMSNHLLTHYRYEDLCDILKKDKESLLSIISISKANSHIKNKKSLYSTSKANSHIEKQKSLSHSVVTMHNSANAHLGVEELDNIQKMVSAQINSTQLSIIKARIKRAKIEERKRVKEDQSKALSSKSIQTSNSGSSLPAKTDNTGKSKSNSQTQTKSSNGRHPKYGYARNYYGNVLERDRFNEDKYDENYQADLMQEHYDYSSYDSEDDNRW